MSNRKSLFWDNEYKIMTEIVENEMITQRELSKRLGVSVSTVNVLMNKMIKEGVVKMTYVSQKQVLYMLTPVGGVEKAKKTVNYLKFHYQAIDEIKEQVKRVIKELLNNNDIVFILRNGDELDRVISAAIKELKSSNLYRGVAMIDKIEDIDAYEFNTPALIYMLFDEKMMKLNTTVEGLSFVNLCEKL